MDGFEQKTLKTSRGYTYTYYTSPGDKARPTLFFLHGWPDHAAMWKDIAGPLRSTNHPIIIPDMLGYDGTDKPTDVSAYAWNLVTKDLTDILDAEDRAQCIAIGHDWGSITASRLILYHPERVVGLVNMNAAYRPPNRQPLDLDAANKMTSQTFGFPLWEYWHVFAAPDGPAIMNAALDRVYNAMHGVDGTMKKFFCTPNAMRDYLTGKTNPDVPLRPYAQDAQYKKAFMDRLSRDGFDAPQCWYRATKENVHLEGDCKLPEERDVVNVPALYIGATGDVVARPETMYESIKKGLLPQLEQPDLIDAGHWITDEKPEEVLTLLQDWLKRKFEK